MRDFLKARLTDRRDLTADTATFTLTAEGAAFAGCTPGGHVDLRLPGGLVRSYSLVSWTPDGGAVTIGVKREDAGRGGSSAVHALAVGDVVEVAQPRDDFPLAVGDGAVALVAGGIGVTPLYAMARAAVAVGRAVTVHYLVRSRDLAAFDALLATSGAGYRLHVDDEHGPADLAGLLIEAGGAEVYACGPGPMLDALERVAADLGRPPVRVERFGAAATPTAPVGGTAFTVVLEPTGEEHEVPADRSILDVLRAAGREVDWSCGEGTCGTCIVDVVDPGDGIDHRDEVLTDDERAAADCLALCVSRARGRLTLDL